MRWWLLAIFVVAVSSLIYSETCNCSDKQLLSARRLTTKFTYKATVPEIPKDAKVLELWLPIPSDSEWQKVSNLQVSSPVPYRITQEQKFGNRMVYIRWDMRQRAGDKLEVTVSFVVERKEVLVLGGDGKVVKNCQCSTDCKCEHCRRSKELAKLSLRPETLVPVGGRFLTIAREVTQGKTNNLDKIRALFEHVVATMQYDYKRESPKLGEGDVVFVCDFRKGNCSDFHSYLISLARSLGIPAYLEYGFAIAGIPLPDPLPKEGKIGGYHCWTWVYDEQIGWFPIDASDARRWLDVGKFEIKDFLFGNLVLERSAVAFSRGRDIVLNPPQKGKPLNYFIYPYAEVNGKTVKVQWELSYQLQ
ncbi:MAG: transglutaminase domain-containing protein [Armatimonadota bacterium]|nr:transglutaminase domain-containing protein [Armatimonadota bacterium]MDW8142894.1 transglutaminase domain-containing protein [Armatimonadota bacterium]